MFNPDNLPYIDEMRDCTFGWEIAEKKNYPTTVGQSECPWKVLYSDFENYLYGFNRVLNTEGLKHYLYPLTASLIKSEATLNILDFMGPGYVFTDNDLHKFLRGTGLRQKYVAVTLSDPRIAYENIKADNRPDEFYDPISRYRVMQRRGIDFTMITGDILTQNPWQALDDFVNVNGGFSLILNRAIAGWNFASKADSGSKDTVLATLVGACADNLVPGGIMLSDAPFRSIQDFKRKEYQAIMKPQNTHTDSELIIKAQTFKQMLISRQ